jgi:hypothetical protein
MHTTARMAKNKPPDDQMNVASSETVLLLVSEKKDKFRNRTLYST